MLHVPTSAGPSVSVIAQGTAAATATALITAWNAVTAGQFAEVTAATGGSGIVQLTADTPGVPFTVASAVSGGAGTIGAATTSTTNQSPNDVNDAVNWSDGIPTASDVLYIDNTNVSLLWNLDALSAVATTSINISQSFTGQLGLKEINTRGTPYQEYRARYFSIQTTTFNCGLNLNSGSGSGLIRYDAGSATATTFNVFNTGSPIESGVEALVIKGTNAANVLTHTGGSVGVAVVGGDVSTIATINCGPNSAGAAQPALRLGVGCTLTTINLDNGTLYLNSACTTLNHKNGTSRIQGSGAITTVNCQGGQIVHQGTGTIGTLNIGSNATFDLGDAGPAITVTNLINMYANAGFFDRGFRGAYANGIKANQCRLAELRIDVGPNRTAVFS